MENRYDDEREIDLKEIFLAIKEKIFLILAVGLLCGCLAGAGTKLFITPTYTSTFSMLAISKEASLDASTSAADLQLGAQLVKHYEILVQSTPVLEKVIENLGLDMKAGELRENITIVNPADTRILEVSVVDTDPEMAKKIVDELAKEGSAYISDRMEVNPPKIIENGQLPTHKTGPNVKKNAVLGLMLGLFLTAGAVVLLALLNDTIKTEEDITKHLNIPILASVPDRKDFINTKKRRKVNKKKKKNRREGRK